MSQVAGSLVVKIARLRASSASATAASASDHRLLAARHLRLGGHHVEGGHGADAHLDLVLLQELLGQGQALALGLQVVDGVEEVVVRAASRWPRVLTTVWRNCTSEISRFFLATLIW